MALVALNKQLLDEVFVICIIISVEVRVISPAGGEADNSYRDIDNLAYHKNRIYTLWRNPFTKSNNCFIIDFNLKIINMACKTIKNN